MNISRRIAVAIFATSIAFAQEPEIASEEEPELSLSEEEGAGNSIPAGIETGISTARSLTKPIVSASILAGGLAAVIYGVVQDREVSSSVKKKDCGCAESAQTKRNIGYAVGTAMLAGGVTFFILF